MSITAVQEPPDRVAYEDLPPGFRCRYTHCLALAFALASLAHLALVGLRRSSRLCSDSRVFSVRHRHTLSCLQDPQLCLSLAAEFWR